MEIGDLLCDGVGEIVWRLFLEGHCVAFVEFVKLLVCFGFCWVEIEGEEGAGCGVGIWWDFFELYTVLYQDADG